VCGRPRVLYTAGLRNRGEPGPPRGQKRDDVGPGPPRRRPVPRVQVAQHPVHRLLGGPGRRASWLRSRLRASYCPAALGPPLLYLCNNQSLLKAVTRWIGEGGKATLVRAPDADILAAAIEILQKRIAAGTATFLVKVKAHRGEPANEGADILADKAILEKKLKEWTVEPPSLILVSFLLFPEKTKKRRVAKTVIG